MYNYITNITNKMAYFYKSKIPEIDEIVICRVQTISEYGIKVTLDEYDNMEGFMNCGEVSRKRKVNLNKLLIIDKKILLNVIRVDKEKRLIDLSKRTISQEDIKLFDEKHKTYIKLYKLFTFVFMKYYNVTIYEEIDDIELHNFMIWSLWTIQEEFENDEIVEKILNKNTNKELIDKINYENIGVGISNTIFTNIINNYIDDKVNRIKPEISDIVKLTTLSLNGLDDIKYSLNYKNFSFYEELQKDFDIKIMCTTSSVYSIEIKQLEFDLNRSIEIADALTMIKNEIKTRSDEKSIKNKIVI
jgi:translation initiation factor 2 alpha subunit (eIF-2alpha)